MTELATTEITMPRLSDSMDEGTIVRWLIEDGHPVAQGQELVEIETDKATIVHVADADGMLWIIAAEGTTLAVGAPIARIGEAVPEARAGAPAPAPASVSAERRSNGGASATPLARRAARIHAVELAGVAATGPRGRITRADVLEAAGAAIAQPRRATERVPATVDSDAGAATLCQLKGDAHTLQQSRRQQLVARRMTEAKTTIPHFQVQAEAAMDAAMALRSDLKASAGADDVPSLNDLIVKACAIALRRHPRANGSYVEDPSGGSVVIQHGRVNIGVAVAAEDALLVPVVTDADMKSLGAIARETRRLAERVRSNEITPRELSGATFTVSNLGMYGMTAITPVIDPPQAGILGVGALRETLARIDGELAELTLMTITLSCDHRILYGADAARLLADIRALLQTPLVLAL